MKPEVIAETVEIWTKEPDKAKVSPSATAKMEGAKAVIEAGPFKLETDLPPALGGSNAAPSPTLLLLSALAGCGAVFVRDTLAPQMGIEVDSVEAVAQCDADMGGLVGTEGAVPDLTNLRLVVRVSSSGGEADAKRLSEVWSERCPIYLALSKPMDVQVNFEAGI